MFCFNIVSAFTNKIKNSEYNYHTRYPTNDRVNDKYRYSLLQGIRKAVSCRIGGNYKVQYLTSARSMSQEQLVEGTKSDHNHGTRSSPGQNTLTASQSSIIEKLKKQKGTSGISCDIVQSSGFTDTARFY